MGDDVKYENETSFATVFPQQVTENLLKKKEIFGREF